MQEKILIIDFGSQFTQLIARRVRECSVYCEIHSCKVIDRLFLEKFSPAAIILSGGPSSVVKGRKGPEVDPIIWKFGVPVLGICYGQQLMCTMLGGEVEDSSDREFGQAFVEVMADSPFCVPVWKKGNHYQVWMSHGDRIVSLPEGFSVLARSPSAPCAVIADEKRRFYGVQFHPEVTHTPDGTKLLHHFLYDIAGCGGQWNMSSFLEDSITAIRKQVGNKKVLCAISGGVDSSVVAALVHRAVGEQLVCVFVDTGLLRKNERSIVESRFRDVFHIPVHVVDASEIFLRQLQEVVDPEQKRKIIGATFIEVLEEKAKQLGGADFIAQGTLYPDVIESVSVHGDQAVTIKSHHNVGGLPERMNLALLEPVRSLFKDEVRALGRALGMHSQLLNRHPFPGPGLAIRIPGAVSKDKIAILQEVDAIYLEEIKQAEIYDDIWQAFAVLLPVKSVGVMGDARTYEYVCALRAVTSVDGMTADFYDFPHALLRRISTRIINQVKGVNRVVYDITSKPPGTIEWE